MKENNNITKSYEDLNIFEKAQWVLFFRTEILKYCEKANITPPTDEQMSEYIESGYTACRDTDVEDFLADYVEKEGMFRN